MDELPVGLILYGADRRPARINGVARRLLGLRPHDEQARCAELPDLPGCREAVDRVIEDGFTREVNLSPAWIEGAPRRARWVAAYAPDGERCPALVLLDTTAEADLAAARAMLAGCVAVLREAGSGRDGGAAAARAGELAREAEALLPVGAPDHRGVEVIAVGALLRAAQEALAARLALEGARFDASGADVALAVVEIDGRARRAVESLLSWALAARGGAPVVRVRVLAVEGAARVVVRGAADAASPGDELTACLGPMGGACGERVNEDQVERWVSLALA